MSNSGPKNIEVTKQLILWTVVGAIVGAVGGGVGFSDSGINVQAGLIGLVVGAVVMGSLTALALAAATQLPPWLGQGLAGAFFGSLIGGILWELRFDRKMYAQLTGAGVGLLLAILLVNRERIRAFVSGKAAPSAQQNPGEKPST